MNETTVVKVIEILIGVKCHVTHQDVTPRAGVEARRPERKISISLAFPEDPDLAKSWGKHLLKTGLSFTVPDMAIVAFCVWYKSIRRKSVW